MYRNGVSVVVCPVRPADESDTGEYVLDDERSIGKSRYGQVRQEERRLATCCISISDSRRMDSVLSLSVVDLHTTLLSS